MSYLTHRDTGDETPETLPLSRTAWSIEQIRSCAHRLRRSVHLPHLLECGKCGVYVRYGEPEDEPIEETQGGLPCATSAAPTRATARTVHLAVIGPGTEVRA